MHYRSWKGNSVAGGAVGADHRCPGGPSREIDAVLRWQVLASGLRGQSCSDLPRHSGGRLGWGLPEGLGGV